MQIPSPELQATASYDRQLLPLGRRAGRLSTLPFTRNPHEHERPHASTKGSELPHSQGRNLCKDPCHTRSRRGRRAGRAGSWEVSEVFTDVPRLS